MPRPIFILGSASERRSDLLKQIGYAPDEIVFPDIDEEQKLSEKPEGYALRIANEKLEAIEKQYPRSENLILTADTVVVCNGRIIGKAFSHRDVNLALKTLSGRRHNVLTAICLAHKEKVHHRCVVTSVKFKKLDEKEIQNYVNTGEGIGKAGGYSIQGHAAKFVKWISGSYTNVVGLPTYEVYLLLKQYL